MLKVVTEATQSLQEALDDAASAGTMSATALRDTTTAVKALSRGLGKSPNDLRTPEFAALTTDEIRAALSIGRPRATPKTLANYSSAIVGLQASVGVTRLRALTKYPDLTPSRRPKRLNLPYSVAMPENASAAMAALLTDICTYKTDAFARAPSRKKTWRPSTATPVRAALAGLMSAVAAELQAQQRPLPTTPHDWLTALITPDLVQDAVRRRMRYTESRGAELEAEHHGKIIVNRGLNATALSLTHLTTTMTEFVPDRYPSLATQAHDGKAQLVAFTKALDRQALASSQPDLRPDVSHLQPQDLWRVGTATLRLIESGRYVASHPNTAISFARTGAILALCAELPLRPLNWVLMTWGNLTRRNDRWELIIPHSDLKIAVRRGAKNEVRHTFSQHASHVIDRWRTFIESQLGPVALTPTTTVWGSESRSTLSTPKRRMVEVERLNSGIRGLWIFATNHDEMQAHLARRIVATYLIRWGFANGADGLALAAHALGDSIKTIIDNYYVPNTNAFEQYADEVTRTLDQPQPDRTHADAA